MANERLPGREADRPAKPSAPLRQRLQQSWQGKVGSPDSPKTGGFGRASEIPKHIFSVWMLSHSQNRHVLLYRIPDFTRSC